MLKSLLSFLALCASAVTGLAGIQSMAVSTGSFTLSGAPFTNLANSYQTLRVHGWTQPGSNQTFLCLPPGTICYDLHSDSSFSVDSFKDTTGSPNSVTALSHGDFVVRWTRNATANPPQTILEFWDAATEVCQSNIQTITHLGTPDWTAGGSSGAGMGGTITANVAWWRWYSGLPTAPLCTGMPMETDPHGDVFNWEFEDPNSTNPITDNTGHVNNFSIATRNYSTTPVYVPSCQGQTTGSGFDQPINTVRTSFYTPITWISCRAVSGAAQTYNWTINSCPGASLSNSTASIPSLLSPADGDCSLNLGVTNATGTTNITTAFGSVTQNNNGFVVTGNTQIDAILGPMVPCDQSTFFCDRNRAWMELLGDAQTSQTYYADQWNTALAGTVTVANGGGVTTVTGTGTDFQNTFCGGGTTQTPNALFILWPRDTNAVGGTRRVDMQVGGTMTCVSPTQLVFSRQFNGLIDDGVTPLHYSRWDYANNWTGGSENVQYYDVCMAQYSLWYRTQMSIFRNYARTLCDRWFTQPYFQQGLNDCNVDVCFQGPRIVAYTGMVMRALDGRPDMWPGLRTWSDSVYTKEMGQWNDGVREDAARLSVQALCGMVDPDLTHRATCQTRVRDTVNNIWAVQQRSDGAWANSLYSGSGYSICSNQCADFAPGTITAIPGSNVITIAGTTWNSVTIPGFCTLPCPIWLWPTTTNPAPPPAKDNTGGDTKTFKLITQLNSTQYQIDRPYDGTLNCVSGGCGYQIAAYTGMGTQAFHQMYAVASLDYSAKALTGSSVTNAASTVTTINTLMQNGTAWLTKSGIIGNELNINFFGPWYVRNATNCEPKSVALLDQNCSQGLFSDTNSIQGIRYINMEIMHGLCMTWLRTRDQALHDSIYRLWQATYGTYDANNVGTGYLNNGTFDWNNTHAKNGGFPFGWGLGSCVEAILRMAPAPASSTSFGMTTQ